MARNPVACAELARTLREPYAKFRILKTLQESKVHITINSMAYYHSESLFVVYLCIYVSIIYVISGLCEAYTYMSLREGCKKLARI